MKSDAEVQATKDDVEMLKRPHLWRGGKLCLKQRDKKGRPVAFGIIDTWTAAPPLVIASSTSAQTWSYPSAEAAVKDGWVVD